MTPTWYHHEEHLYETMQWDANQFDYARQDISQPVRVALVQSMVDTMNRSRVASSTYRRRHPCSV